MATFNGTFIEAASKETDGGGVWRTDPGYVDATRHIASFKQTAGFIFELDGSITSADLNSADFTYNLGNAAQEVHVTATIIPDVTAFVDGGGTRPADYYSTTHGTVKIDVTGTASPPTVDLVTPLGSALDSSTNNGSGGSHSIAVIFESDTGGAVSCQILCGTGGGPPTLVVDAEASLDVEESGNAPQAQAEVITANANIHRENVSYDDGLAGSADQRYYQRWDPIDNIQNIVHVFTAGGGYGQVLGYEETHRDVMLAKGHAFIDANYKVTGLYNAAKFSTTYNTGYIWPEPIQDMIVLVKHVSTGALDGIAEGYFLTGHSAGSHTAMSAAMFLNDDTWYTANCTNGGIRRSTAWTSDMDEYQFGFTQGVASRIGLTPPLGVYLFAHPFNLQGTYQDGTLASPVRTILRNALEALFGVYEDDLTGGVLLGYGDTDLYPNGEGDLQDAFTGGMEDSRSVYYRRAHLDPLGTGTKIPPGHHTPACPVLIMEGCDSRYFFSNNPSFPSGPFGQGDNVIGNGSGNWEGARDALIERDIPYTDPGHAESADFAADWSPSNERWEGDPNDLTEPFIFVTHDFGGISGLTGLETGHDLLYYGDGFRTKWLLIDGGAVDQFVDAVLDGGATHGGVHIAGHNEPAIAAAGYNGEVQAQPIEVGGFLTIWLTFTTGDPVMAGELELVDRDGDGLNFDFDIGDTTMGGITPPASSGDGPDNPHLPELATIPHIH